METEKKGRIVKVSILLVAVLLLCASMHCGDLIRYLPNDWALRDGDILLLGSSTIRARILKLLDCGAPWAHCGIVVMPNAIVHADPEEGVVCCEINEYLANNDVDCICLLRPNGGNGEVAARFALDCAEKRIKFDHSFSYKTGNGMYCTELVLMAWESAGEVIIPNVKEGDRVKPSELTKSKILQQIKLIVE